MPKDREFDKSWEIARALMILKNYEWITQEASKVNVKIIPIKGIDLLQNIYFENLDRYINDIDILCYNETDCIKLVKRLCKEDYRLEFPFSIRREALNSKHKVSLLSCNTTKVNIDIHTAFVTKKFFSQTIGKFNSDALKRCHNGQMDELDRWLFLAQHATFHIFSDKKWTKDLKILYNNFSSEQKAELIKKASDYCFKRILIAAMFHVYKENVSVLQEKLENIDLKSSERKMLYFIRHFDRPFTHSAYDRLISAYWEFVFIEHKYVRFKTWLSLIFPTKGMLTNIYRIKQRKMILFFYPLNIFIAGFTSGIFWILYNIICAYEKIKRKYTA